MPEKLLVGPEPDNASLYTPIEALNQDGEPVALWAVTEKLLTIFFNGKEVVTTMNIGDHPECLAVGFLLNQRMLEPDDEIVSIRHDAEDGTVFVRTGDSVHVDGGEPKKRIHTSGCAVATMFGDVLESLDNIRLDPTPKLKISDLYNAVLTIKGLPTLHQKTGSVHRCVLCEENRPIIYMEDVGRHNALDKIAGYMRLHGIGRENKYIYCTGRLTSEVVIKTVIMGLPILVSRSGFSAMGIELARKTGLTLIGRCRGRTFQLLSAPERVVYDLPA